MKPFEWLKSTWNESKLFRYTLIILAVLIPLTYVTQFAISEAKAVDTGAYAETDQGGKGHGIQILCNQQDQCVVYWFNYSAEGDTLWLISEPLCQRGVPCSTEFYQPISTWNGFGGFTLGEPVASADIEVVDDALSITYEAVDLLGDYCDTGSGGLILRECIGTIDMQRFAR